MTTNSAELGLSEEPAVPEARAKPLLSTAFARWPHDPEKVRSGVAP